MLFNKVAIFLFTLCTAFYAHSVTSGENNMIKLVFALKITDEKKYLEYRDKIKPLMNELNIMVLKEYRISKVVHSNSKKESVNMLAMFGFPSQETKEKFFSNNVYQEAKLLFSESTMNFSKHVEE
ncbi:hypothetical protein MNBD_GAMMA05-1555 [hydrothermal vent metagenome]|uniref:DUF1330 domain-containing protein n=1 Tax=hydrothermal vent metagenome TaxID=652676 RepID=A0A3B0X540_9ZZZZ